MKSPLALLFVGLFLLGNSHADRDILYKNYLAAIKNGRNPEQSFVVITVKNNNTGEKREVCTQFNFLSGAVHLEHGLPYDSAGIKKAIDIMTANKARSFAFSNDSALINIGFDGLYTTEELEKLISQVDFDQLAKNIIKKGTWSKTFVNIEKPFRETKKVLRMYAHSLFNRGVLTSDFSCVGGTLTYVPS